MSKIMKAITKHKDEASGIETNTYNRNIPHEAMAKGARENALDHPVEQQVQGPNKIMLMVVAGSIVAIALTVFLANRISSVNQGVSMTNSQIAQIKTLIQDQKSEIAALRLEVGKFKALNNKYEDLNDRIVKKNSDLANSLNQVVNKLNSKLEKTSISFSHMQTSLIELKTNQQKLGKEISYLSNKLKAQHLMANQ